MALIYSQKVKFKKKEEVKPPLFNIKSNNYLVGVAAAIESAILCCSAATALIES